MIDVRLLALMTGTEQVSKALVFSPQGTLPISREQFNVFTAKSSSLTCAVLSTVTSFVLVFCVITLRQYSNAFRPY